MGRNAKWVLSIVATIGVVLLAMQNCSQVEFQKLQDEEYRKISEENNMFVVGSEPVEFAGDGDSGDGDSNSGDGDGDSGTASGDGDSGNSNGDGDDDSSSNPNASVSSNDPDGASVTACGNLNVRDIIIDILSIEVKTEGNKKYQLNIGSGPADLLDLANGINFVPERNLNINQLRILLGSENYVLTTSEKIYPLQITNQQSSGLIVLLNGRTELAKDVTYHLTLDFDPQFHIKGNGERCILHPNVRARIE